MKDLQKPHVVAVPFPAPGHSIPFLDMAILLASHGLTVSYVTTPANVCRLQQPILEAVDNGLDIRLVVLPAPAVEGLPEGCESADLLPVESAGLITTLMEKIQQSFNLWMQRQLEEEQVTTAPICVIHDFFIRWAPEVANKYNIASVMFNICGAFAISLLYSISRSILQYNALEKQGEDTIVLSMDLPTPLRLHAYEISDSFVEPDLSNPDQIFILEQFQGITKGCGLLVNTFSELESCYLEHLKNVTNKPVWAIGPLLPQQKLGRAAKLRARGKMADIGVEEVLGWLNSQRPCSTVYVSFGSLVCLSEEQTNALARGLEASAQPFVWAIRLPPTIKPATADLDRSTTYLPDGFLERTKNRGMVIWGWAPQLLILSHRSVGAFMSHCGWNSTLESTTLGIPVIGWPIFGDQFFNKRLLAGLGMGIQLSCDTSRIPNEERVEEVVRLVLTEDKGKEMRKRAEKLKEMAKKAVQLEGSSTVDLESFVSYLCKLNISSGKSKRNT